MEINNNEFKIGKGLNFNKSLKDTYKLILEANNEQKFSTDNNLVKSLISWQKYRTIDKSLKMYKSLEEIKNLGNTFADLKDENYNKILLNEMTLDPVKLANAMLWCDTAFKYPASINQEEVNKINENISDAIKNGANVFLVKQIYDQTIEKINKQLAQTDKNSEKFNELKSSRKKFESVINKYIPQLDKDGFYPESSIPQTDVFGNYTSDGGSYGSAYYSIFNQLKCLDNALKIKNDSRGMASIRVEEEKQLFENLLKDLDLNIEYLDFVFKDNELYKDLNNVINSNYNNESSN